MSPALRSAGHEAVAPQPPPARISPRAAQARLPGEGLAKALLQPGRKPSWEPQAADIPWQSCGPHLSVESSSASGALGVQRRCHPDLRGQGLWSVLGPPTLLEGTACPVGAALGRDHSASTRVEPKLVQSSQLTPPTWFIHAFIHSITSSLRLHRAGTCCVPATCWVKDTQRTKVSAPESPQGRRGAHKHLPACVHTHAHGQ